MGCDGCYERELADDQPTKIEHSLLCLPIKYHNKNASKCVRRQSTDNGSSRSVDPFPPRGMGPGALFRQPLSCSRESCWPNAPPVAKFLGACRHSLAQVTQPRRKRRTKPTAHNAGNPSKPTLLPVNARHRAHSRTPIEAPEGNHAMPASPESLTSERPFGKVTKNGASYNGFTWKSPKDLSEQIVAVSRTTSQAACPPSHSPPTPGADQTALKKKRKKHKPKRATKNVSTR